MYGQRGMYEPLASVGQLALMVLEAYGTALGRDLFCEQQQEVQVWQLVATMHNEPLRRDAVGVALRSFPAAVWSPEAAALLYASKVQPVNRAWEEMCISRLSRAWGQPALSLLSSWARWSMHRQAPQHDRACALPALRPCLHPMWLTNNRGCL